jgi:hypothetical protein
MDQNLRHSFPAPNTARIFTYVLRGGGILVAGIFVLTLVIAQNGCPNLRCNGPEGDGWMLPLFFSPIGVPALLWVIFFIAKEIWTHPQAVVKAGTSLKYLVWIAMIVWLWQIIKGFVRAYS